MWDHHQAATDRRTWADTEENELTEITLWKQGAAALSENQGNRNWEGQGLIWNWYGKLKIYVKLIKYWINKQCCGK